MTQRTPLDPPRSVPSSPRIASSGRAATMPSTIAYSAARSISVTRSAALDFSSTENPCSRPSRWIAAARSARSTASARSSFSSVGETLVLLRHDGGSDRPAREHRLVQELGRRLAEVAARPADLPHLELARAAAAADLDDAALRFDPVPGVQRRQEFHALVRAEQPLVAVVSHRELGDQVADDLELLRAGDEAPAVMRVLGPEPAADVRGGQLLAHGPSLLSHRRVAQPDPAQRHTRKLTVLAPDHVGLRILVVVLEHTHDF